MIRIISELNSDCTQLIPLTVALVEGDEFVHQTLWMETSIEAAQVFGHRGQVKNEIYNWDERSRTSGMQEVGRINDRPIVVEFMFQNINGMWICFYTGCSVLVDHQMIKEWVDKTFTNAMITNADNFNNVLRVANSRNPFAGVVVLDDNT